MRILMMVSAAAVALVSASPAEAGSAACLWEHAPQAKRDRMVAAYQQDVAQALQTKIVDSADFDAAVRACTSNPSDAAVNAAGAAFAGYEMQYATGVWLMRELRVTSAHLDTAWAQVAGDAARFFELPDGEEMRTSRNLAIVRFHEALMRASGGSASTPPQSALPYLAIYLYGRWGREKYEPLF